MSALPAAKGTSQIRVVFFQRRPDDTNFSVEGLFQEIRSHMGPKIAPVVAISSFVSRGVWPRVYNTVEAVFRQGDVNHITGDVHYLAYFLQKRRTVLTMLDCAFTRNPSPFRRAVLRLLWYVVPEKRAAVITTISEAAKAELLENLGCAPDKIRVVPACVSSAYSPHPKPFDAVKPTVLQVGTRENKNLLRLIEAVKGLNCRLDIVGKLSPEQEAALAAHSIDYTASSGLTDDEMRRKYQACDVVAFVSTYEGFGMPILEANAIGRPVVTSHLMSMPEVAGEAACIVDPYDVDAIRTGLRRIFEDADYRESLVRKGFENVKRYDPARIAAMYAGIYAELVRGHG